MRMNDKYIMERTAPEADSLLPGDILAGLTAARFGRAAEHHAEIGSTNTRARELAMDGAADGTLVIAEMQTAGRGRLTRTWQSPAGAGIYMSLIMRPRIDTERMALLTPAVALGVCRGLSAFCGDVRIKWPNDIVCAGRKLCGMLLEAHAGAGGLEWVVAGIGINAHQRIEDFEGEVQRTAGSIDIVTGGRCSRAAVVRAVLGEIERCVDMLTGGEVGRLMEEYARMSATLGKRVRVIAMDGEYEATAMALLEDGALLVRTDDGCERPVYAGDVSVRGLMGYA